MINRQPETATISGCCQDFAGAVFGHPCKAHWALSGGRQDLGACEAAKPLVASWLACAECSLLQSGCLVLSTDQGLSNLALAGARGWRHSATSLSLLFGNNHVVRSNDQQCSLTAKCCTSRVLASRILRSLGVISMLRAMHSVGGSSDG